MLELRGSEVVHRQLVRGYTVTWGSMFHVATDPHASGRLYVSISRTPGYAIAGDDNRPHLLFVSSDRGATWHSVTYSDSPLPLFTFPHPRVAGLVLGVERTQTGGNLLKSDDYGENWVPLAKLDTVASKLEFDSVDDKRIYAATEMGLLISTDGGAVWSAAGNGLSGGPVRSLDVLEDGDLIVWQDRIYRSTDHGASWQAGVALDSQIRSFIPSWSQPGVSYAFTPDNMLKSTNNGQDWKTVNQGLRSYSAYGIAYAPSDPKTMYLLSSLESSNRSGLYASQDGGLHWSRISIPPGHSGWQAIAVHPKEPEHVYLASSLGISISTDGGKTWRMTKTNSKADAFSGGLVIDPAHPNRAYASFGSGVERSDDGGETWQHVNSEVKVSRLAFHVRSGALYAGGESGLLVSKDEGQSWQLLSEWRVYSFAVDDAEAPTIYMSDPPTAPLKKSTDGGKTWTALRFGVSWVSEILIGPEDEVYLATNSMGVLGSTDGGASWHPINSGLGSGKTSHIIAASEEVASIYLASDLHGLYRLESTPGIKLVFPALLENDTTVTGVAVANSRPAPADLELTARESDGQLADAAENPRKMALGGFEQLALTGRELFAAAGGKPLEGWVELNSPAEHLSGLFMNLGPDQADGAQAATVTSNQLCFSRIHQGSEGFLGQEATTRLYLVNPSSQPTTVTLQLFKDDGTQITYFEGIIAPNGSLSGTIPELFGVSSMSSGYVNAVVSYSYPQSLGGITGFELVELPDAKTRFGLQAADAVFLREGYSAQVACVSGAETRIRLINLSEEKRKVGLQLYGESGALLAPEIEVELAPRIALDKPARDLFFFAAGQFPVGSLRVIADGAGVLGDVVFGDFDEFKRMAALPVESRSFKQASFGQVANGLGYYTGLALFNPSAQPAEVTLQVYSADGQETGNTVFHLPAFGRISRLLPELVPQTEGQVRGWVRLSSSEPIVAQELFGTDTLLAAVPRAPRD